MRKVTVSASSEYDIIIDKGIIDRVGEEAAKITAPCRAAVITDDTVEGLYGERVKYSLEKSGFSLCAFSFSHGEQSKNISTLSDILEFLAEEEITRQDIIIALGGGVAGDMAGFAAAVYQRGIPFIQMPTTFLAAVDSSVGGKTAIDLKAGKNMAGAFYQPRLVLCDTETFKTLPDEVFADGVAEALKYGVIGNRELFYNIADKSFLSELEATVEACVRMKRDIVMRDEFDTGERQVLNLGHTLGHSIEKNSNFTLSHGHAVAMGMYLIARIAEKKGIAREGLAEEIKKALESNSLPWKTDFSPKDIASGALMDKKRRGNTITFIFPEEIGRCSMKKIRVSEVEGLVKDGMKAW